MGLLKIVYASSWTLWCNVHHPEIFSISIVNGCFKMPCTALFIYLFIIIIIIIIIIMLLLLFLFIYLFIVLFIHFYQKSITIGQRIWFFSGPLRP